MMIRITNLKQLFVAACLMVCLDGFATGQEPAALGTKSQGESAKSQETFSVKRIWDQASHSAFTDLIKWNGGFYCAFRIGTRHVYGEDGRIQVIRSVDGDSWQSQEVLAESEIDLRDPKLSIAPDGRLMLLMGGSNYEGKKLLDRSTRVAFLKPGADRFSAIQKIQIDDRIRSNDDWLWRVTWHEDTGAGFVYQPRNKTNRFHLVKTTDGVEYELVESVSIPDKPNETTIRFTENGELRIVARTVGNGQYGAADSLGSEIRWQTIPLRLGGPDLIRLPSGAWILGTRQYSQPNKTVIGVLNQDASFAKRFEFPSSGDTSYPGMIIEGNELWVSYYSSHESIEGSIRTSIYLARVPLDQLESNK